MKSRVSIAISILLLGAPSVSYACGPYYYEPEGYFMYRVSDKYLSRYYGSSMEYNFGANENCKLWQSQTSKNIPLSDIYDVVYKADAAWTYNLLHHNTQRRILNINKDYNRFTEWLWDDSEATEFLLLAKRCEETRDQMKSPWYYPLKKDPQKMTLEDIIDQASAYKGKRFADRYLLQIERALFSLHRYDECINKWNELGSSIPDNVIRRLTLRYVAGAYYNLGDNSTAMKLYGEAGDTESLLYCSSENDLDYYEVLYRYAPESKALRDDVERWVLDAEYMIGGNVAGEEEAVKNLQQKENERLNSCVTFCKKVASEGKVSDPDFWYYTAAFMEHLTGRNSDASWTLSKVWKSKGSDYIKESARVLSIYLNALDPYSPTYEKRTLEGAQWLAAKVNEHIDEGKEETIKYGMYSTRINMSYFYWNDMLRKVIHSAIVPRLRKSNRESLAIAYSNMADNHIFNLVGMVDAGWSSEQRMPLDKYRREGTFNSLDYSNLTAKLLDETSIESIIRYVANLDNPESEAVRYLNNHGYTNRDYFYDFIGTRMIRDMRYAEAETWLCKVSPSFQNQLNTYRDGYLSFDPFAPEKTRIGTRPDVKYNFAREMASLERAIKETRNVDRKAALMVRFATGMKSSFGNCWALSFYGVSAWDSLVDGEYTVFTKAQKAGFDRAERLYASALSICRDKETAAQIHMFLGNAKTVTDRYKTTRAAEYIRGHCDTYKDYHFEKRKTFWPNVMGI